MRARLLAAGFLVAACARGDQTVTVGPGTTFSPSSVVIAPGEKVTWVWTGVYHSSTSDSPSGPEAWDSGIIFIGSFDHNFTVPGLYPYYCQVHSFPGGTAMNGSVQVVAPTTPTPSPTATSPPGLTPPPAVTATPTITPFTPVADATPPSGGAVPTLGGGGMLALALSLAALAYLLLSRAAR